jgi:hypothetical protein
MPKKTSMKGVKKAYKSIGKAKDKAYKAIDKIKKKKGKK